MFQYLKKPTSGCTSGRKLSPKIPPEKNRPGHRGRIGPITNLNRLKCQKTPSMAFKSHGGIVRVKKNFRFLVKFPILTGKKWFNLKTP